MHDDIATSDKTKLDRKKLDKEISFIQHEDSAGVLLNGGNHIYGRIHVSKERERLTNKDQLMLHENVNYVIDEVMEYEPEMLVPNIDDHVFNDRGSGPKVGAIFILAGDLSFRSHQNSEKNRQTVNKKRRDYY
jgi:hypothetical protein